MKTPIQPHQLTVSTVWYTLSDFLRPWLERASDESRRLVQFLERRMNRLIALWISVSCAAGLLKVLASPLPAQSFSHALGMLLPFLCVSLAPVAGYRLAARGVARGTLLAQPSIRLAHIGRWQALDSRQARDNPAFGPTGLMASLLVGLLLNVVLRTAEYLAAIPALGAGAPQWGLVTFHAMTADVVAMNFLYMVCFVMALRASPIFPRMMVLAWTMDIAMQFFIANQVAQTSGLPGAVELAMSDLLSGNIKKVMISVLIWMPYLIVSDRVNVTYRQRCRAG